MDIDNEYRAYEGFKSDRNISKNRLRINFSNGSCDILQYGLIYKIAFDGNQHIFIIYGDGVYRISGDHLHGLAEALQHEMVSAINPISSTQQAITGKPVIETVEFVPNSDR